MDFANRRQVLRWLAANATVMRFGLTESGSLQSPRHSALPVAAIHPCPLSGMWGCRPATWQEWDARTIWNPQFQPACVEGRAARHAARALRIREATCLQAAESCEAVRIRRQPTNSLSFRQDTLPRGGIPTGTGWLLLPLRANETGRQTLNRDAHGELRNWLASQKRLRRISDFKVRFTRFQPFHDGVHSPANCFGFLQATFPNDRHPPASRCQPLPGFCVAPNVARELLQPIVCASSWSGGEWATWMAVPKASMHKDRSTVLREDQIGATCNVGGMEAISQPSGMQRLSERQLGFGVLAPDASHYP